MLRPALSQARTWSYKSIFHLELLFTGIGACLWASRVHVTCLWYPDWSTIQCLVDYAEDNLYRILVLARRLFFPTATAWQSVWRTRRWSPRSCFRNWFYRPTSGSRECGSTWQTWSRPWSWTSCPSVIPLALPSRMHLWRLVGRREDLTLSHSKPGEISRVLAS